MRYEMGKIIDSCELKTKTNKKEMFKKREKKEKIRKRMRTYRHLFGSC